MSGIRWRGISWRWGHYYRVSLRVSRFAGHVECDSQEIGVGYKFEDELHSKRLTQGAPLAHLELAMICQIRSELR